MGLFLTDANCIRQREYVGIPKWHDKGFKGKGITIFHDDVEESHSECCADIIQTILPEAKVLRGEINYSSSNNAITSCAVTCNGETLPFEEFIIKHNVTQINNSTGGKDNGDYLESPIAKYMKEMIIKYNLFCTGSAGNYAGMTNNFQGAFVLVSGVHFYAGTDTIMDYGSAGKPVDFSMFMGFQMGTSFSAPFLNGMAGLLRSKNPNITQTEIYEYFKSHCKDLGDTGRDAEYGWGLPIMGDAKTIIKLTVGSKVMTVDGREIQIDQPPIISVDSWRTLVPVRSISEAFGATVNWDEKTQTITIER